MENAKSITNYEDLQEIAIKSELPLFVLLELGNYPSLMTEVISSLQAEAPKRFKLIKIHGLPARTIQSDLNVLNLPALVILNKEKITAIYQGLIAKHELQSILDKIK